MAGGTYWAERRGGVQDVVYKLQLLVAAEVEALPELLVDVQHAHGLGEHHLLLRGCMRGALHGAWLSGRTSGSIGLQALLP